MNFRIRLVSVPHSAFRVGSIFPQQRTWMAGVDRVGRVGIAHRPVYSLVLLVGIAHPTTTILTNQTGVTTKNLVYKEYVPQDFFTPICMLMYSISGI